jgi:hypothetical protein
MPTFPPPSLTPNNDDDYGWPQPHSPGPFVTLGNGKVTSNGKWARHHSTVLKPEKSAVLAFCLLAALVAKSGVFFFFTLSMNLAPNSCQFLWELQAIDCRFGLLEQRFILDFTNSAKKINFEMDFFWRWQLQLTKDSVL